MAWRTKDEYSRASSPSSSPSKDLDNQEKTGFLSDRIRHDYTNARPFPLRLYFITGCNVVLFVISCILFGTWYHETHWKLNAALRGASTYSPILDRLDLEMKPAKLNGTLFTPKDPSIARQMPNPEADAIWEEWELTRYFPVTADQIRAMGKDPSTAAKLQDEDWGLGDDAYVAILDVYHQLHCLNSLRRIAYGEYYNTSGAGLHHTSHKGEMYEVHINHCVDMLMQTLQCSGNVNLITLHWVAEQEYPFPDMSVNKQCVNFEKLSQWRKENTLDLDKYVEKMRKGDQAQANEVPAPDDYYKYYLPDKVNPNHLNGANAGEDFNL